MMYYCQWPMITCLGGSREFKYRGTVVGKDDCVYGIPDRAKRIVKFDPTNPDTTSTVGGGKLALRKGSIVGMLVYWVVMVTSRLRMVLVKY